MKFLDVIDLGFFDVVEIALVAYLLYRLYVLMRGTIAVQIFFGLLALTLIQLLVTTVDMTIFGALFEELNRVFLLAIIVLFQPELRRLLLLLGQNPLVRRFVSPGAQDEMIDEVVNAVSEMSKSRIGALIVIERSSGLRNYIETGAELHAKVTRDLLITIFYSQNPLHDGAVIIRGRRIEAARCILPVSTSMRLSPHLGLRHRAAVGLTEQTDAFVVICSEETGNISVSRNGELVSNLTVSELRQHLTEALTSQAATDAEMAVTEEQ